MLTNDTSLKELQTVTFKVNYCLCEIYKKSHVCDLMLHSAIHHKTRILDFSRNYYIIVYN